MHHLNEQWDGVGVWGHISVADSSFCDAIISAEDLQNTDAREAESLEISA